MRVLIVEDSESLRASLIQALSTIDGVDVVGQAADANTAIELIEKIKPELVILDVRLYQSNGLQVLRGVHERSPALLEEKPPPVRVMVLTNYPYPQYRKKFLEAGAQYFFDKSNEFDQAFQVIKNLNQQLKHDTKPRTDRNSKQTVNE